MQRERAFRILSLLLFFGSIFDVLTVLIGKLPLFVTIPVLWALLAICTAAIGKRYGKATAVAADIVYAAFTLLSMHFAYASSIALSIAFLSFPFVWDAELQHKSLKKIFNYLGLKTEGFLVNALLGVATTIFIIGPLVIAEAIVVVMLLHLEEPEKVSMIVSGLPLYILIFSFTIGPIAEEIFFRGFLLSRVGIILSSLLFALAHYSYGSYTEFLAAFTAGFVFAVLYKKSKSIIPSIFAHAAFNFINVIMVVLYYSQMIK
jgi:membrane protease YdiL (CAAX protease family)